MKNVSEKFGWMERHFRVCPKVTSLAEMCEKCGLKGEVGIHAHGGQRSFVLWSIRSNILMGDPGTQAGSRDISDEGFCLCRRVVWDIDIFQNHELPHSLNFSLGTAVLKNIYHTYTQIYTHCLGFNNCAFAVINNSTRAQEIKTLQQHCAAK